MRVRRAVESEHKLQKPALNTNSLKNYDNSQVSPTETNHSPILFIDDETAGIIDVTKTTTVNRVLQDLS
jgi:hypothetical protein